MKLKSILIFSVFTVLLFVFSSFDGKSVLYPSGAPAGYTGSPADGHNCTHCHGGTAVHLDNVISSTIPETGYIPNATYQITATLTGSGKKGFEISPQNFAGDILGTLSPGTGSKLTGNGAYITHSSGNSSGTAVWTFNWTAPDEGTGDVVFYGAFAIRESHTKLNTLLVHEDVAAGINQLAVNQLQVGPNPFSRNLLVSYSLASSQPVEMKIYSLSGNEYTALSEQIQSIGKHQLNITMPNNFQRGIVLLQITANGKQMVKKLIYN